VNLIILNRFASKYASRPQLALNFLTGLTHASANNLELLDGPLSEALGRLKAADHFERNFVVLMGDHGQRIVRQNGEKASEDLIDFPLHRVPSNKAGRVA
jgi:hypothetical protein